MIKPFQNEFVKNLISKKYCSIKCFFASIAINIYIGICTWMSYEENHLICVNYSYQFCFNIYMRSQSYLYIFK